MQILNFNTLAAMLELFVERALWYFFVSRVYEYIVNSTLFGASSISTSRRPLPLSFSVCKLPYGGEGAGGGRRAMGVLLGGDGRAAGLGTWRALTWWCRARCHPPCSYE
ncbi:unnamed protein product [Pieris brassicae]|uniref:Uncharacterized protein n=1 Tax=Pieris brassicae TaxID=7116 RepID=A0A9P0XEW2_PIEBR|nr:unnamed protein product [Pieris brassicae]